MRLTLVHKLAIGLAVLSTLGLVAMLVVYRGLATVERAMRHLAELREPASTAAHEMEINLNEIGLAVFKYLDSADPAARNRVAGDEAEFERFRIRYLELAHTEEERQFAATLGERFGEFTELAQALLARRAEQETAFQIASENFETLDAIIDENLDRWGGRVTGAQSWKLFFSLDIEADLAGVAVWLANYQRTHQPAHRALIESNEEEVRSALRRLKELPLTRAEQAWAARVETLFDETMALVDQIAAADEDIRGRAAQFDALRVSIDDLLDEQVQAAAFQGLAAPREEADRATERVVRALQYLIPGYLLAGLVVGVVLLRVITEPLKRLARGTAAISAGELSYRVTGFARDEFGELADHFNRMVERLEATTVSKERLEASQAQLRTSVDDLREQISERRRAEAEQARLQESLRRNETMSAMGSLVAGVAHEVRNPLFGISSTLDALEARLGAREETRRHLAVLRGEVDRLTRLMQHLLNYGRPVGGTHVPDTIAGAVAEAVNTCAVLARDAGVRIEQRLDDGGVAVAIDRAAMAQVFRNLLENAIQHSPPGGIITVETNVTQHDGRCWLGCTVTDAGPGFHPDDLARVFEPFYTRRRGGTGLGLSIVQRIVEDHDGRVQAANRSGRGAVVTVSLPSAVVTAKILLVEDEAAARFGMREFLEAHGFAVEEADSAAAALAAFRDFRPDAAIVDYALPDGNALELLPRLREIEAAVPVVILTGHGSIDLAVRAIKEGAEQFLTKPVELPALLVVLQRVLEDQRNRQKQLAGRVRDSRAAVDPFAGASPAIRRLADEAHKVLASESPVLIQGETGTGKGVLARWLHDHGPRAEEAFVDLNCASLSREFLETELFGHEKGAFTGAAGRKLGLLEIAHRGTVFLDEIGDMDVAVQPKLLTVLEEKRFRRLAGVRDQRVDVRLIAATHQDLAVLVRERTFRSDLYFRISTIPLVVPPLRERREDVPMLARTLLHGVAADLRRGAVTLSADAERALGAQAWPGNVREPRNVLERAVLLSGRSVLEARDLSVSAEPPAAAAGSDAHLTLLELERRHIETVLRAEHGHVERAATRLGVPRSSLYEKIRRHGIVVPRG